METSSSSDHAGVVPAKDDGESFIHILKEAAASAALRGARDGSMGNGAQKLHGTRAERPESLESDDCKLMDGASMLALVCGVLGVATARTP